MRLLLIEDEEKVARFIVKGLTAERYAVDAAADGASGLELAFAYSYDLIILDLMLPGLSGAAPLVMQAATRTEHLPGGAELLIYSLPFTARAGSRFLIETGVSYESVEDTLRGLLLTLAIGLPLVLLIAVAGGYGIAGRALRPLDQIASGAEQITSRNLSERLPVALTGDEIERLAVALNRMIARLDESFQYIRRFTADASHELRTPLTVLRGELEAAARKPQLDPDVSETLGSALEETERLSRIVDSLLAISRLDAGEAQMECVRFDLAELVASTTDQMRLLAEDKHITLVCQADGRTEIIGDRARIKQVIVKSIVTAHDGRVTVESTEGSGRGVPRSVAAQAGMNPSSPP